MKTTAARSRIAETILSGFDSRALQSQTRRLSLGEMSGEKLTARDLRDYDENRLFRRLAGAGAEADYGLPGEISADATRTWGLVPFGIWWPWGVAFGRDFSAGSGSQAGALIASGTIATGYTQQSLRPAAPLEAAGATISAGFAADFGVAGFDSGPQAATAAETGAAADGSATTRGVAFSAKRVAVKLRYSRQWAAQYPRAGATALAEVRNALNDEILRQVIGGSGTGNDLTGLLTAAGLGEVVGGTDGAAIAHAHLTALEYETRNANGIEGGNASFVCSPKVRKWLREKPRGTGLDFCWRESDRPLLGKPAFVTSAMPDDLSKGSASGTCSAMLYSCAWDRLLIAFFGPGLDLLVNPYSRAAQGEVEVHAAALVDAHPLEVAAFSRMKDGLTA